MKRPQIYDFLSYVDFIRSLIEYHKTSNSKFSHRQFATRIGLKSPSTLHSLLNGKSKIARKKALKFADALELRAQERTFFYHLVDLGLAKHPFERKEILDRLAKEKKFRERHPLLAAQIRYYTNWYYPMVREALHFSNPAKSPGDIRKRLVWPLEESQVHQALEDLQELGLVQKVQGQWRPTHELVHAPDRIGGELLFSYQETMIGLGAKALHQLKSRERDIRSSTFCMDRKDWERLRERLERFQFELIEEFESKAESKTLGVQLNLQAFPFARTEMD